MPAPELANLNVRVPRALLRAVRLLAVKGERRVSTIVIEAITEQLQREQSYELGRRSAKR